MLNSFIIVLREGFESFLLVAVILSYLHKSGQKWLSSAVYVALGLGLTVSAALGYVLAKGVDDSRLVQIFGERLGGSVSQFLGNEALREGVLGLIAMVMVGTLVVHMWRTGPKLRQRMHQRLGEMSSQTSRLAALAGVFLFTFLMITREGMETALLLMQVRDSQLVTGALLGLGAALLFALAWARFGHLINVKRFFQVTGIFLLLFMLQVGIYSFHEFSEAGLLPNSEMLHEATEKFSPDGLYGKWFSLAMISVCALWLGGAWAIDRLRQRHQTSAVLVSNLSESH
ncbi:MAG: FTR1 family protein [Acidobacteriota bacterium]